MEEDLEEKDLKDKELKDQDQTDLQWDLDLRIEDKDLKIRDADVGDNVVKGEDQEDQNIGDQSLRNKDHPDKGISKTERIDTSFESPKNNLIAVGEIWV